METIKDATIKKINEKINDRGLKKKHIADQIGISNVCLSYYLNRKRTMPMHIKAKLICLLGMI